MSGPCRVCGKWPPLFGGNHQCPPKWECWMPQYGEERWHSRAIYASDAEEAAEDFAKEYDSCDSEYTIASGTPEEVHVSQVGSEKVQRFEVFGEFDPTYRATEVTDAPDGVGEEASATDTGEGD